MDLYEIIIRNLNMKKCVKSVCSCDRVNTNLNENSHSNYLGSNILIKISVTYVYKGKHQIPKNLQKRQE